MSTGNAKRIANNCRFCEARADMERIIDRLMSREALSTTLSEVERLVGTEGQEHDRVHRSRYADGEVPTPLPRSRPTLKLVK
jgi:hypothetical protein